MSEKKHESNIKESYLRNVHMKDVCPTLIVSDKLLQQIYKMHKTSPEGVEWCGALLYKIEKGTFKDVNNMELKAYAFYPLSIDSSIFTSAKMSDNLLAINSYFPESDGYLSMNKKGRKHKIGLIHTHHKMESYFSNTDLEELWGTTPHHVYYLSLIVNYSGMMVAKLAVKTELETKQNLKFQDDDNVISVDDLAKDEIILHYDCVIELENSDPVFDKKAEEEVENYYKKKKAQEQQYKNNKSNNQLRQVWNNPENQYKKLTEDTSNNRELRIENKVHQLLSLTPHPQSTFLSFLVETAKAFENEDHFELYKLYYEDNYHKFIIDNIFVPNITEKGAKNLLKALTDFIMDYTIPTNSKLTYKEKEFVGKILDLGMESLGEMECDLEMIFEENPV